MAGGLGTRLRPLTCDRPKPLVPVANRPLLEHLVRLLKRHGFEEIYLTTHYLPGHIERALGDGSRFGVTLHYAIEPYPLGTAGAVSRVARSFSETFLVISGDCLTDIDLRKAVDFHRSRGAVATMVVKEVEDPRQYGIVSADERGRVRRFLEKPAPEEVFSRTANTGIYVLEPEALDGCPDGVPYDFSKELFPKLLSAGEPLYAAPGDGYWSDIGSCTQYIRSQVDALERKVKLAGLPEAPRGLWLHPTAVVDRGARLVPPVMIGRGARIAAGARVGPGTVLGDGCEVHEEAVVERSVVWEWGTIGPESVVLGAAVGAGAVVEERVRLLEGAAVAGGARVRADRTVHEGEKVWADGSTPG